MTDTLPFMDMMPEAYRQLYGELSWSDLFQALTLLVVQFLYYFIYESVSGRTLGKSLCRTVVVDVNGNKAPVWRILIRTLCRFIPFDNFSFFFAGYDEDGRLRGAWHDKISGTYVVDARLKALWDAGRYDGSDRFAAAMDIIADFQKQREEELADEEEETADIEGQDTGDDGYRGRDGENGGHRLRVEDLYPQDGPDSEDDN